ncbi:hypothetical protein ES703_53569 [subsurface metagenome]
MRQSVIVLLGILLIGVAISSLLAKTTQYTYPKWTHTEVYPNWGPAEYYGEAVWVEYTSDNSWAAKQEPETIDVEKELPLDRMFNKRAQRGSTAWQLVNCSILEDSSVMSVI